MAGEVQSKGIVFAIARIGHFHFAQYRSIECARCTQTVNAEGIVTPVVRCPLLVIDDARSNHVHVEVRHHVSTYYHGAVLFVESTYHSGQCIFIGIYVVAVQLYGKLAAFGVVYAHVPATADAEVVAFGDDMDEALVILILVDGFCRSVGGVVVDDDKIELEVCLLRPVRNG